MFALIFLTILSSTSESFDILECARPIQCRSNNSSRSFSCLEHCFVVYAHNGLPKDSRGFFGDVGSQEENNLMLGNPKCRIVKKFTSEIEAIKSWKEITQTYDKYTSVDYSVTSRNCCTVASEALRKLVGKDTTLYVEAANSGIGTKCDLRSTET